MTRAFRQFWAAGTVGQLGGGVSGAAFPLLAASLSSQPTHVAAVAVAFELPALLLGLPAGAVADRVDRRRLAATVTFVGALVVAGLAIAAAAGHVTLALLYVAAFGCGAAGSFAGAATATMTPVLVEEAHLERANGRLVTAGSACSEFAGPPLGGFLFMAASAIPFAFHAVAGAVAAVLLRSLPDRFAVDREESRAGLSDIADGLRWLARHARLRTITLLSVTFAITDSAWFALMALYVTQILDLPAGSYGIVVGVAGAGGLVGGLAAAGLARVWSTQILLPALLLAAAGGQIVLAATTHPVVATAALAISSFAFGVWNVVTVTLFQRLTPTHLLGRAMAADRTAIMGASPLGALLGGLAATAFGLRAPFLLGLPLLLVAAGAGYWLLRKATPA